MKTIAIDNGHGLNTPGKRTPIMLDGKVIKEWQFNYPTAKKLGELLKYNGFNIIYVSDTEEDNPLSVRTKKANDTKADAYVSIHFNAHQGVWGNHGGIETYHYPNSTKSKELVGLIQDELIRETGLRNRGVKSANFQVLRETNMVSILAECGFMDNLEEAKLMLDGDYQLKCARAIAKGICKYFGVEYKEEKKDIDCSSWAVDAMEWAIELGLTDGTNPKDPITLERFITILHRYSEALE
ncbi:N-acetylmuramoyl-L-alanine amidase [Tissierella sp.]|uniref:N-acetylmuramoyl-L-alanine amidase family protein n=1 Tax=Tissierella sp. TaxID=41274 RepID=UPI00302AB333